MVAKGIQVIGRLSVKGILITALCALPCSFSKAGGGSGESPPTTASSDVARIEYVTTEFRGNLLVISYKVNYPGLMKIKMYTPDNQLLWRNQYISDKNVDYEIPLKAEKLTSGETYVFELEYKAKKEIRTVIAP